MEFYLTIDNERIKQVEFTIFLGVIIDQKFTWQRHISYVSIKISKSLYALRQVKFKLPRKSLVALYYSIIYPHLTYCNIMWGCASVTILQELLLLQKRAIRTINKSSYLAHTAPIFKDLAILKLSDINVYSTVFFIYKCIHNYLPLVCNQFLTAIDSVGLADKIYNLRTVNEYLIPPSRTNMRAKCINVRGPKQWMTLPDEVRNATSLSNFKNTLFSFIFSTYK